MEESKPRFMVAWINIVCAIFSCLGAFIFGFDSGAVASTYTGGTAIGGLFSGWSAGKFGRKKTIIGAATIVAFGTTLQTAAQNLGMLIAGRVIAGLAVGILLSIVPVYNAELAVPQHRGVIVGLFAVLASFGVVCSNWIGYGCQFAYGDAQWRIPLGCQIPPAIILGIGGFFLPESPRWLIEQNRSQEAHNIADRMGRKDSMWIGAIVLVIDLVVLMPLTKIYTGSENHAGKAAAVTFIFLHSYPYSVFMYGTVWVYTSEMFPTRLRAKGVAICTFWGQAFNILLQQIGLKVFEEIGYLFYIVFIVCTSFAALVYYLFLPETKGATLEDISRFFGDPVVATLNESQSRIAKVLNEVDGLADTGDDGGERRGGGSAVLVDEKRD
ncbi:hypothetical protein V491_07774 [Pseudogymnoascus sp. VKM F-3775]|nr:hypothetical protein V491_07774 [Pseudogymnoascus sp. VKM F-3775]